MNVLKKHLKNLDVFDMSLVKLSVAAFVLFLLKILPGFMNWLHNTNAWWFIGAFVIFAIRPIVRWFK